MNLTSADLLRDIVEAMLPSSGDVKHIKRKEPEMKPPRRKPGVKNQSQRDDYSKNYMQEYREEGKDYQKVPDKVKEYRRQQKKRLKEKLEKFAEYKTWTQIQADEDPHGEKHCLKLVCVKCGNTRTCRCTSPKVERQGVCQACTGEWDRYKESW